MKTGCFKKGKWPEGKRSSCIRQDVINAGVLKKLHKALHIGAGRRTGISRF